MDLDPKITINWHQQKQQQLSRGSERKSGTGRSNVRLWSSGPSPDVPQGICTPHFLTLSKIPYPCQYHVLLVETLLPQPIRRQVLKRARFCTNLNADWLIQQQCPWCSSSTNAYPAASGTAAEESLHRVWAMIMWSECNTHMHAHSQQTLVHTHLSASDILSAALWPAILLADSSLSLSARDRVKALTCTCISLSTVACIFPHCACTFFSSACSSFNSSISLSASSRWPSRFFISVSRFTLRSCNSKHTDDAHTTHHEMCFHSRLQSLNRVNWHM